MRGIRRRAYRTVMHIGLSSAIIGVSAPETAWALTYPADGNWLALTQTSLPISDNSGDAPGPRDIVGNAEFPMAYVQSDGTHLYFRLRANQTILSSPTNVRPYGWGCVIDANGDPSNYEYSAILDGVGRDVVWLWKNTMQEMPNNPADAPDMPELFAYMDPLDMGKPYYDYARERSAGTVFPMSNPDPDFFADWAIERSKLGPAVGPLTPLRFACGSASDGKNVTYDLSGPPHLPDLFSDPVLCDALGCVVQTCAEFGTTCSVGVGGCATTGTMVCLADGAFCNAIAKQPSTETCNGVDDNCDGVVDEDAPGSGLECSSGMPGICSLGTTACANGVITCNAKLTPQTEICNKLDDDCNGIPDDGPAGGGKPCVTGYQGVCATGFTSCGNGQDQCVAVSKPREHAETCNGLDDDCNGFTDEVFALGTPCTVGIGACAATGKMDCDGTGGASCDAIPNTPTPEICGDLVDSDCDGNLDNNCPDTDGDGIPDHIETEVGTDPNDADTDDDGVRDGMEIDWDQDSDGDGTINVLDPDSDDDGLFDGTEIGLDCGGVGTDPAAGHCIADADEGQTTTNPIDADTDHGSLPDGKEDLNGNGVVDPGEKNPLDPKDDVDVTPECLDDSNCITGQICVEGICEEGCRVDVATSCPIGQTCSASGSDVGQCVTDPTLTGIIVSGGGCACQTGSSSGLPAGIACALAIAAALALRRKKH